MRRVFAAACAVFILLSAQLGAADPIAGRKSSIRIQGRSDVIVTEPAVRLGDIAQIDSQSVLDDELIIKLRTISLGRSPKVGESIILEGVKVLEQLRLEGISLDSLLYSFPRQMKVTRAFREVSSEELEKALKNFLTTQDRNLDVRQLVVDQPIRIPTDSFGVEVVGLQATQPGHFGIDYRSVAGSDEVRFQMRAIADEWRLMPVAVRPLKKGAVVTASDVQLTKVNGTAAGRDAIEQLGDVVGRSLVRDIGQGEMFRTSSVVVPPVVVSGARVSMVFRRGRLEATARGIALENGVEGQEIKVRNEATKKVVSARVVDKGMVEVEAQ